MERFWIGRMFRSRVSLVAFTVGVLAICGGRLSVAEAATAHETGVVFFPPTALRNIQQNAQRVPLIRQWLDRQFASAHTDEHALPHPRQRLDIADTLHSEDARVISKAFDHLLALGLDYAFNRNPASLQTAQDWLTAWATTYVPMGHPLVEQPFTVYVMSYELVRDHLSEAARNAIDTFLLKLYEMQVAHLRDPSFKMMAYSNKWSTHCANTAAIAFLRNDPDEIAYAQACYVDQLTHNLFPAVTFDEVFPMLARKFPTLAGKRYVQGVTLDFIQRDALEYQLTSLGSLFTTALAAENNGLHWFALEGEKGQRLAWAFDFLIPYATGEQRHYEFGETLDTLDQQHKREKWFDPRDAVRMLTLAVRIDPKYAAYADARTLNRDVQLAAYAGFPDLPGPGK